MAEFSAKLISEIALTASIASVFGFYFYRKKNFNNAPPKQVRTNERYKRSIYEWGGPVGVAVWLTFLPIFTVWIHTAARHFNHSILDPQMYDWENVKPLILEQIMPTTYGSTVLAIWFSWQAMLYVFLPGKRVSGIPDPDTHEIRYYKENGLLAYIMSLAGIFILYQYEILVPSQLIKHYTSMMVTTTVCCFIGALLLWLKGRNIKGLDNHATGNFLYDFWEGIERHPRIGYIDIKFFFEGRPGLIGWVSMAIIFCMAQYDKYGEVSYPMLLVAIGHNSYILFYFWVEHYVLSTIDIYYERFGFMLLFGDAGWLPFMYLQAEWFLLDNSPEWSIYVIMFFALLAAAGLTNMIKSNLERDKFKRGDNERQTFTMRKWDGGTRTYMVDGLSSLARRPNYWPDLLNGVAWSIPCGFTNLLPWFYAIYFFILLLHRDHRLEERGKEKYQNWNEWCERVPYRFIPYIY